MTKLVITRGLPASGKTTFARAWVEEEPKRLRVNRDDLRFNLFGRYTNVDEETVTRIQRAAVRGALASGWSVVVDDTHLQARHARAWLELAEGLGVDLELVDMPTSLDECIARDTERGFRGERAVGEAVIRRMASRYRPYDLPPAAAVAVYVPNTALPLTWIVDVDGTLARMTDRGPFEWHRVGEDEPVENVIWLVRALSHSNQIVIVSGRDSVCRPETEAWLKKHGVPYDRLLMRAAMDNRSDAIIKRELFENEIAPKHHVVGVLDDRDRVVALWRRIGLLCAQVAPGDF